MLQISGHNGGDCTELERHHSTVAGANRVVTCSEVYDNLGSIRHLRVKHDHMATPAMNIPTGMDTGDDPSLELKDDLYEDGTPIIVFHT